MQRGEASHTIEGGMGAVLAGMVGQWVGFVGFRLAQLFTDWLTSILTAQPRSFESVPAGFLLIPPPHTWNIMVVVGSVIAVLAYWIHTSPINDVNRRRRRFAFNTIVVLTVVVVGRIGNLVYDWGILVMAFHDAVQIVIALWVTWRLIEGTSYLLRRSQK